MKFNPAIHHRRSIRLKGYDYAQEGAYFVTICTEDRECVFGEVAEEEMRLSSIGDVAQQYWREIPNHFANVTIDEYIIMPNHMHGIIIIEPRVGVQYIVPLRQQNKFQHIVRNSIGSIIRSYKASVTRISRRNGFAEFSWQRGFYEHIIRDEADLDRIGRYIADNPVQWYYDEENPARQS